MRWPWQPRPGMVRVSNRKLIGLLSGALRAAELEAEIQEQRVLAATLGAEARAAALLESEECSPDELQARAEVLAAVPLTSDGRLHEPALLALYQARLWEHRDREREALIATSTGDQA